VGGFRSAEAGDGGEGAGEGEGAIHRPYEVGFSQEENFHNKIEEKKRAKTKREGVEGEAVA
jgi:hypothetical protein